MASLSEFSVHARRKKTVADSVLFVDMNLYPGPRLQSVQEEVAVWWPLVSMRVHGRET